MVFNLKKILPQGLFRRSLLIILAPIIFIQFVLAYIFFDRHTQTVVNVLSKSIAGDIAWVWDQINNKKETKYFIKERASSFLDLNIKIHSSANLEKTGWHKNSWLYQSLGEALNARLKAPYFLRMDSDFIFVFIQSDDGLVEIKTLRKRLFSRTTPLVIIWTLVSSLIFFLVASIFMRNQIKPLLRLAQATKSFGQGDNTYPIKVEGAKEVRQLASTFNVMRQRLQRHLNDRTEMLACVSHDLRTVLTRFRLQVNLLESTQYVEEMEKDIDEMQSMLEGFLAYARGGQEEIKENVNLYELIENIWNYMPYKEQHISFECLIPKDIFLYIKKKTFNRCILNIFSNSIRYATFVLVKGKLLSYKDSSHNVYELVIEDNGPGIDPKERENVFKPFYRIDQARKIHTGSVGLGLSIVKDAVHAHGGKVILGQASYLKGLRVTITIPC
jgi:two-component system osmolarity sensor histidine kinase EnvZ